MVTESNVVLVNITFPFSSDPRSVGLQTTTEGKFGHAVTHIEAEAFRDSLSSQLYPNLPSGQSHVLSVLGLTKGLGHSTTHSELL